MKQYVLTNWSMENHQSIFGAFVLRGLIQGHPTLADGTEVRTTAVTSMDNEARVAYTHHSGAFAISTETMSDAWRQQVIASSGGTDTDGSSFLTDSFEQGPFQDDDGSNAIQQLQSALGLDGDDGSDTDGDDSGLDIDAALGGEGGDDTGTDSLGDGSDADMGGLPPGLLQLLQGMGDDDGLGADADAVPAPKRQRKSRAKQAA